MALLVWVVVAGPVRAYLGLRPLPAFMDILPPSADPVNSPHKGVYGKGIVGFGCDHPPKGVFNIMEAWAFQEG